MTLTEQIEFFDEFVNKMRTTLLSKGDDYASEDRLSNFKVAANLVGTTPEKIALTMLGIKLARLSVLLNGKTPKNESIEDSVMDGANYFVLLAMLLDKKNA
jgi:hypothetical protein